MLVPSSMENQINKILSVYENLAFQKNRIFLKFKNLNQIRIKCEIIEPD